MSEENKGSRYMEVLDQWTKSTIIQPLEAAFDCAVDEATVVAICKAIREKQLESYRNGLKGVGRTFPQQQVLKGGQAFDRRSRVQTRF